MSILGIDLGSVSCVAVTINKGVLETVRNDVSERATPALVGFTDKERLFGERASAQLRSNLKNTCRYIKQVLGCTGSMQEHIAQEQRFSFCPLSPTTDPQEGNLVGYQVTYMQQLMLITATRCLAAVLANLREMAQRYIGTTVHDVVVAVPSWYPEQSRQAVLDAAEIAGLSCLRVMNEHAAVALDYGIFRSHSFSSQTPTRTAFIGVGHCTSTVCVADFVQGELKIVSANANSNLGGRNFERAIVEHFAEVFYKQYGVNPMEHPRAIFKLEEAAAKAKKILSANSSAGFHVECVLEEKDIAASITRDEFASLCEPFRQQLLKLLTDTFEQAGISPDTVQSVEIYGGCTRIPWIQDCITGFFGGRLELSRTLVPDETIARGCVLQAAMLCPRFRVRNFSVADRIFEPISVSWMASGSTEAQPELKTATLFEKGSALGVKKWLTFQRTASFDVYLTPPCPSVPLVVRIEPPVEQVPPDCPRRFKLKARLSMNGTVCWETANYLIDEEVTDIVKEKRPPGAKEAEQQVTTDGAVADPEADSVERSEAASATSPELDVAADLAQAPDGGPAVVATNTNLYEEVEVERKRIETRVFDCRIVPLLREGYLTMKALTAAAASEREMSLNDKTQTETAAALNSCEAFLYQTRSRLNGTLSEFVTPEEKQLVLAALESAEDWLYDNADGSKDLFLAKHQELEELVKEAHSRERDFTRIHESFGSLSKLLVDLSRAIVSPDYGHVDPTAMEGLVTKIRSLEIWLGDMKAQFASMSRTSAPTFPADPIVQEYENLRQLASSVLVAPPPPPVETTATVEGGGEAGPVASPGPDVAMDQVEELETETLSGAKEGEDLFKGTNINSPNINDENM